MKKLIGLGVLMVTGMTAFAAPAAAYERFDGCNGRKEVVVVRHDNRGGDHRDVRGANDRGRR
jgi:hypothetical protein